MQKATIRKFSKDEIIRMKSQLSDVSVTEFRLVERNFNKIAPLLSKLDDVIDIGVSNPEEGYKIMVDILGIKGELTLTDDFFNNLMNSLPVIFGLSCGRSIARYYEDLKNPQMHDVYRAAVWGVISAVLSMVMSGYESYFYNKYASIRKAVSNYAKVRLDTLKEVFSYFPSQPLKFINGMFMQFLKGYYEMWKVQFKIMEVDESNTYCLLFWMNNIANVCIVYYSLKAMVKYVKGTID